jgi:hypothetical protein
VEALTTGERGVVLVPLFYIPARKPRAFKPGDEWQPGAKRRPIIFVAGYSRL